jgi:hypothetical protein
MKNKKMLYYLIPLNLIVWSLAVYRIFSFGSDEQPSFTHTPLQTLHVKSPMLSDTFDLILNYPDPFLKKTGKKTLGQSKPKTQAAAQKNISDKASAIKNGIKPTIQPVIIYRGMVKNRKTGNTIALLHIEGSELSLQKGEIHNKIKILQIHTDSVKLEWNKQVWFAKK